MCWLFVLSISVFTLASVGCAASDNFPILIAWRVLQGFSGGTLIPSVFSAVFLLFPVSATGYCNHVRWRAGGASADRRTDRRRLDYRDLFLALAVLDQCRAWNYCGGCRRHPVAKGADAAWRSPQARCAVVDPVGDCACGAGNSAQGSADARLELRPRHGPIGDQPRKRGRLCQAHAQGVTPDRQAQRPSPTEVSRSVAFSVSYWGSASSAPFISCRFFWPSSEAIMLWRSASIMLVTGVTQLLTAPIAVALEQRVDARLLTFLGFGAVWRRSRAQRTADAGNRF